MISDRQDPRDHHREQWTANPRGQHLQTPRVSEAVSWWWWIPILRGCAAVPTGIPPVGWCWTNWGRKKRSGFGCLWFLRHYRAPSTSARPYPTDKPETKVNSFVGVYSKPEPGSYATPWTGMNPIIFGLSLSHLQKMDNLDVGFGINLYSDQGYIMGTPVPPPHIKDTIPDNAFNKGAFTKRAKIYFNTRVRNKKMMG